MNQASEQDMLPLLKQPWILEIVEETGSTSDDLKAAARAGAPDYTVRIAARQTGGRGRAGRSFHSENGLFMSFLLPWREEAAPFATHVAAIAVARALEETAGEHAEIKWVNDLLIRGKKVCGILSESVIAGEDRRLVVGIGVNVDAPSESFPDEIKKIAGSVSCDKSRLAAAILNDFRALYDDFSAERIRREYRERLFPAGTCVTVFRQGSSREATVVGTDRNLGLIVRYTDGTIETLISGEVRIGSV